MVAATPGANNDPHVFLTAIALQPRTMTPEYPGDPRQHPKQKAAFLAEKPRGEVLTGPTQDQKTEFVAVTTRGRKLTLTEGLVRTAAIESLPWPEQKQIEANVDTKTNRTMTARRRIGGRAGLTQTTMSVTGIVGSRASGGKGSGVAIASIEARVDILGMEPTMRAGGLLHDKMTCWLYVALPSSLCEV